MRSPQQAGLPFLHLFGRQLGDGDIGEPAETIAWRQWHHWNVARDAFVVTLPKGVSVLSVHIVTGGNLNLATMLFRPVGAERNGPDITAISTPAGAGRAP